MNRFKLRMWDPVLKKGAIWTYWEGAYRDTGRDEGATMVLQTAGQARLVLVHPAARQHRQRRRRRAVRLPVQGPRRRSRSRSTSKKSRRCPAVKERIADAQARDRLLRDARLLLPLDAGRRRRLGAGRRRVRLPRSALFVRRAAGAQVRRAGRRRDRRRAGEAATPAPRSSGTWGADFNAGRGPHAPAGVRVLRRLQLRPVRASSYPDLRGTSPTC